MIRASKSILTHMALVFALCVGISTPPVTAQTAPTSFFATENPDLYRMLGAMGIYDVLGIMSTESTNSAVEIEAQMFPGAGGEAWQDLIAQLYAPVRMTALFEGAFPQDSVSAEHETALTDFVLSASGQRIIAGELAARRTFLDAAAVEGAIEGFVAAVEAGNPRLEILRRFNDANGLVERNVSGALNLRYIFFTGLSDGGAFEQPIPEATMLADVWSQEPEVRRTTVEWLFAFQLLAYADVTDAELEAYVALSETPAGRAVNLALFTAFDAMLADLSYDIGAAAATFIGGEDI